MGDNFKPFMLIWMTERAEEGYIGSFPSNAYDTHEDAYNENDVIEAFAVLDEESNIWLKLVSLKFPQIVEFVQLPKKESTDKEYAREFQDDEYLNKQVDSFDAELHFRRGVAN